MNRASQTRQTALLIAALVLGFACGISAQTDFAIPEGLPALSPPILVTTCGQSPGSLMVTVICEGLGYPVTEAATITDVGLEAECETGGDCASATLESPYRVLFVTTGTSLKGMGAAGVDIDSEIERCQNLIYLAKKIGVFVIVGQVEGPSRRTDEYDEKSIRAISPLADLLITQSDINEDGYFTTLAEEEAIPQIFIKRTLDLKKVLPLLFATDPGSEEQTSS